MFLKQSRNFHVKIFTIQSSVLNHNSPLSCLKHSVDVIDYSQSIWGSAALINGCISKEPTHPVQATMFSSAWYPLYGPALRDEGK